MVLLPEVMEAGVSLAGGFFPGLTQALAYIKEMSIGLAIILFLIFEPRGLANWWRLLRSYFRNWPFKY
jgi:branched-chain amino acid transport system permease protein